VARACHRATSLVCGFSHSVLARSSFLAWFPHASPLGLDHLFIHSKSALLVSLSCGISEFSPFLQLYFLKKMKAPNMCKFRVKDAYSTPMLLSSSQKSLKGEVKTKFERGKIEVYQTFNNVPYATVVESLKPCYVHGIAFVLRSI